MKDFYGMSDEDLFFKIDRKDRWVYNKFEIAQLFGIKSGFKEMPVERNNYYVIRPIINLSGMGVSTTRMYLTPSSTDFLVKPGHFWSEILKDRYLSVDYCEGKPVLFVEGFRNEHLFQYWRKWQKLPVKDAPPLPKELQHLAIKYKWINVEFIGDKVIEVHLRNNPDFENHEYEELIPVWDKNKPLPKGYTFLKKSEKVGIIERFGFFAK